MDGDIRKIELFARLTAKIEFFKSYGLEAMEMRLLRSLGNLDYEVFHARISTMYLKRKVELMRNLNLPFTSLIPTVSRMLGEEFYSWENELRQCFSRNLRARSYYEEFHQGYNQVNRSYPRLIKGVMLCHPELQFLRKTPAPRRPWKLLLKGFQWGKPKQMDNLMRKLPHSIWEFNDIRRLILGEKTKALRKELEELTNDGAGKFYKKLQEPGWIETEKKKLKHQLEDWKKKRKDYYQQLLLETKITEAP